MDDVSLADHDSPSLVASCPSVASESVRLCSVNTDRPFRGVGPIYSPLSPEAPSIDFLPLLGCSQTALMVLGASTSVDAVRTETPNKSISELPIFRAPVDSGCTATATNELSRLVNVRECDEEFKIADGKSARCTAIGDMPVLAKDASGRIFRFTFKNVRYVPNFKYTLISVKQIWREQAVDSLFADENALKFSDGSLVPFDPRFKLPVVTLVSEPAILKAVSAKSAIAKHSTSIAKQFACIGFYIA